MLTFDPATVDEVVGHNLAPRSSTGLASPPAPTEFSRREAAEVYFRGAHPDAHECANALKAVGFADVEVIGSVVIKATKP